MADEAAEEAPAPKAGGSVLKKWGPMVAIILLAQVVITWVLAQMFFKDNIPDRPPEEPLLEASVAAPQRGPEAEAKGLPFYLPEKLKVTANPAGTNSDRFVVISVELGLVGLDEDGEEVKPADFPATFISEVGKINQYIGRVKAIILEIVRSKTMDQLESNNISEVQKEIKRRLNKEVFEYLFDAAEDGKKEIRISEVIFPEIIIQ
jgi:flagellar basal body-associated protein FliL